MGLANIGAPYQSGLSRDWVKLKDSDSPAMMRAREPSGETWTGFVFARRVTADVSLSDGCLGGRMVGLSRFRFRSLDRDRESDERRIALIREVARFVVADAEAEVAGLRARIVQARRQLMRPLDVDGRPDASRRAELTNLEQHLLVGEQRFARLKVHLALLRSVEVAATRAPR
jgi:hypothetical protein